MSNCMHKHITLPYTHKYVISLCAPLPSFTSCLPASQNVHYYSQIMMDLFFLLMLYGFLGITYQSCNTNCICNTNHARCTIVQCSDSLDVTHGYLIIEGIPCPNHYREIISHPEIYVQLMDADCAQLSNCE